MNKAESKFYNTAKKMHTALFRLMQKKELGNISVMEICKEAAVNRSTFYSHYENTYELLIDARNDFLKSFFRQLNASIDGSVSDLDEIFIAPKYVVPYLKLVKKHKDVFKLFISNAKTFDIDSIFDQAFKQFWINACKRHGITDETVVFYMSHYYLIGITSIVTNWLNRECVDDVVFISEIIKLCVSRPVKSE